MSAVTLYTTTVPLLQRGLTTLSAIVDKAEAYAKEKGTPVSELLEARLIEDMLPFTFQVFIVTDIAHKVVRRVLGEEPESWGRDELATLEGIRARIAATHEILAGADAAKFNADPDTVVPLGVGGGKTLQVPAFGYIQGYGLPTFFFHLQTAYAILRMKGVPLGKSDYIAPFMEPFKPKE